MLFFQKMYLLLFLTQFVQSIDLIGEMPLRPPERVAQNMFSNFTIINNGGMEIEDNNLEKWMNTDWIEVYLGEYKLQDLAVRNGIKFQVHHMGVLFQNVRNRKWYEMDFYAKSADTIANVMMPSIRPSFGEMTWWEKLVAYWNGDFVNHLVWDNLGYVRVREEKTGEFHELMHVGSTRGQEVLNLRQWLVDTYAINTADAPLIFDMWSLYNATNNVRVRSSHNCHDFVEQVLARIKFEETNGMVSFYRDSLSLNVTSMVKLDMSQTKNRRDYQRFLRFLSNHVYESTKDIAHSAVTVTKFIQLGIPFIIFLDGKDFYQVNLSKVFGLNYCRLPMDFEKDSLYVSARLNDTRISCHLPILDADTHYESVTLTLADLLIFAEFKLDNLLQQLPHLSIVLETTVWAIAILKVVHWVRNRK